MATPTTFKELCQRVRSECGISGSGPSTVVGQTGQLERVVNWTSEANDDIQSARTDWRFMWQAITRNIPAGEYMRSPTALSANIDRIDDARTLIYQTSVGLPDATPIEFVPWEVFSLSHLRGALQTGRPLEFSIRPDKMLIFPCFLDNDYTFWIEHYREPVSLSADLDQPLIPLRYRMAIVWKAVMKYADHEEAGSLRLTAEAAYRNIYRRMVRTETPTIRLGDPLE